MPQSRPHVDDDVIYLQPARDRRRRPRLKLLGEIHGTQVGLDLPIVVRDISTGGFSIESSVRFPDQDVRLFEFSAGDGLPPVIVSARALRTVRVKDADAACFLTGFELTEDQAYTDPAIMQAWLLQVAARVGRPLEDEEESDVDADRRRAPRLELMGEVHGVLEDVQVPFLVRDISHGGLCLETHAPLTPNDNHTIRLQLHDLYSLTVRGRIAYCRDISDGPSRPRFLCGVEFVHTSPESQRAVGMILDRLTTALERD